MGLVYQKKHTYIYYIIYMYIYTHIYICYVCIYRCMYIKKMIGFGFAILFYMEVSLQGWASYVQLIIPRDTPGGFKATMAGQLDTPTSFVKGMKKYPP